MTTSTAPPTTPVTDDQLTDVRVLIEDALRFFADHAPAAQAETSVAGVTARDLADNVRDFVDGVGKAAAAAAPAAAPRKKTTAGAAAAAPAVAPEFHAEYPVADMKPHPKNPRRNTVADDGMVASIKELGLFEPVILGPDGTLIAGNRRHDGLLKAKKKTAPAIIRHDLDTPEKQLEAALVENLHREDLTPIEEAEAFASMRDVMKYSAAKIATRTGRPVATVRDRLKLLKLDKSAQDRVHEGQLTLGDALDLVAFDDDPKTQKVLAKAAVEGNNFRYKLEQEKQRRTKRLKVEAWVEELTGLGVETVDLPKGWQYYSGSPEGMRYLGAAGQTFGELRDVSLADLAKKMHKGCLGYTTQTDTYEGQVLRLFCTDDEAHAGDRDKETKATSKVEQERQAEWARQQAEAQAQHEAEAIAAKLRTTAVLGSIGPGLKVDAAVTNVLRTLLPFLIWRTEIDGDLRGYFDMLGVEKEDRWTAGWNAKDGDEAKILGFFDDLGQASPYTLVTHLFALLLDTLESGIKETDDAAERLTTRRYFEYLTATLGHELNEHDQVLIAAAQEPEAAEPVGTPYEFVHTKFAAPAGAETACGLNATIGHTLETHKDPAGVTCPTCLEVLAADVEPHHFNAPGPDYACEDCDQPRDAAVHDVDEDPGT